MKKVSEMKIHWDSEKFNIDGSEYFGIIASKEELKLLENVGITQSEPCGQQICFQGWVWVLIDAPSGIGCQWYKTNAQCNE